MRPETDKGHTSSVSFHWAPPSRISRTMMEEMVRFLSYNLAVYELEKVSDPFDKLGQYCASVICSPDRDIRRETELHVDHVLEIGFIGEITGL